MMELDLNPYDNSVLKHYTAYSLYIMDIHFKSSLIMSTLTKYEILQYVDLYLYSFFFQLVWCYSLGIHRLVLTSVLCLIFIY